MSTQPHKRFVVVGGGVSGLTAAYELQKHLAAGDSLTLLEASEHLGGVLRTSYRDDCILDEGPDCFISTKPEALELCRELGVEGELIGVNPQHRRSFIVNGGQLRPIPEGFFLLAPTSLKALAKNPLLSPAGKLRAATEMLIPPAAGNEDESLDSFVRRRFGDELMDRIAQPMVAGIYTSDPKKLSLRATFPHFLEMEARHGSVIRALLAKSAATTSTASAASKISTASKASTGGAAAAEREASIDGAAKAAGPRYGMFVSFRRGMGQFIEVLQAALNRCEVQTRTRVSRVFPSDTGWILELADGQRMMADGLVLALPAHATAKLLGEGELGADLQAIPYASSATVTLAFERHKVRHPLDGMGFVVPEVEGRKILATSFSSVKWLGRAPAHTALFRVFMGGALHGQMLALPDEELVELARAELQHFVGAEGAPLFSKVRRWHQSMCQYHVGHARRAQRVKDGEAGLAALALAGNCFDGVGIPDCVRNAKAAVARLLAKLR